MPAAWMSSQPRMRRSVSHCRSRPSCMEGVGERRSSGMSEWSMVSDTSEYSRSPIRIPGAAGAGGAATVAEEEEEETEAAAAAATAAVAGGAGCVAEEAMMAELVLTRSRPRTD